MAKILYIKENPKTNDNSITFEMSEQFIAEYKKNNPCDESERVFWPKHSG